MCVHKDRILDDTSLLDLVVYGWSSGWCVEPEYLQTALRICKNLNQDSTILECGSGLSTLVVGLFTADSQIPLVSLEHDAHYARRVSTLLAQYNLRHVHLHVAPLRDFGDFDWYGVDPSVLERPYSLVPCDGPPGTTRGGRIGLVELMAGKLPRGCVILLDDANRPGEQQVLLAWERARKCSIEVRDSRSRKFAVITLL